MQVIVVGSADNKIASLLKQPGRTVLSLDEPAAAQRKPASGDVFVLDARTLEHLPPFVASMTREASGCGFILVCSTLAPTLMLEGMRAGIRECVPEPLDPVELEAAVSRVAAGRDRWPGLRVHRRQGGRGDDDDGGERGHRVEPGGPRRTLLMDLHMSTGDAGLFLGEEPRFSVADAIENVHRLDEGFLRSLVVRSKLHLDLLASADSPSRGRSRADGSGRSSSSPSGTTAIRCSTSRARSRQPSRRWSPTTWIVIVANQELATVKNAGRMAASLRLRYGKERVVVAVARHDGSAGIGRADIERAIGVKVKYVLPSDYRRAVEALNSGQPVSLGNHCALAGSFRQIARDLAGLPASDDGPGRRAASSAS